jgi:GNAT superfamily N-acetyltransferase
MRLNLRPATRADVSLILQLIRELADYEQLLHRVVADEALLAESLFGKVPRAEVTIADVDGSAAGFALYFHNFSTFLGRPGLYLEDLYVRPAFRAHGVGRALLQHLARIAVTRGCGRFEWAALDWNEPAIGFYKKLGAIAQDDWTGYRMEGDVLKRFAAS